MGGYTIRGIIDEGMRWVSGWIIGRWKWEGMEWRGLEVSPRDDTCGCVLLSSCEWQRFDHMCCFYDPTALWRCFWVGCAMLCESEPEQPVVGGLTVTRCNRLVVDPLSCIAHLCNIN